MSRGVWATLEAKARTEARDERSREAVMIWAEGCVDRMEDAARAAFRGERQARIREVFDAAR